MATSGPRQPQPQEPPEQQDPEPPPEPDEQQDPITAENVDNAFSAATPHLGQGALLRSSIFLISSNLWPQDGQTYSYNGIYLTPFLLVSMPSSV